MKHLPLLLPIMVLFTACGAYTPSQSDYSNRPAFAHQRSSLHQRNSLGLPSNPDPNKCYVRCVTNDEYEFYEEKYLTYTAEDAEKYPYELVRLTITPEISQWETTTYEGCESDDPNDCQILCLRTYPAVIDTIYNPVDTTLGNPFWRTLELSALIRKGGLTSYVEIDCELTSYNVLPINFADDSAKVSTDSRHVINERLLILLEEHPNIRIQINAHTDSRGGAHSNQVLTEQRARAVADYLMTNGVRSSRIVTRGYGESQLKNRCADGVNCTEYEHAVNRRVEFRVLSMDN
jgi:outer membrane protein OmpA-like peptidoglycan-associated protein